MKKLSFSLIIIAQLLFFEWLRADVCAFRHPDNLRPLYGRSINALKEDFDGYLWIGTNKGLFCYNGYDLWQSEQWQLPDELYVSNLQEDASHHLWISTSGSSAYEVLTPDHRHLSAADYLQQLGMSTDRIFLMHIDEQGNLWRVTEDSLCYYDFGQKQLFSYAHPRLSSASNQRISVKAFDCTLYILDGKVLHTFSQRHNNWRQETLDLELPTLGGYGTESLMLANSYVDYRGGLWIYSLFGEAIYHRAANSPHWEALALPYVKEERGQNAIRRLAEDQDHTLWIATDHRGLFGYDLASGKVIHAEHRPDDNMSLASDNVNALLVDSHNTLWLGYYKTGVSFSQSRLDLLRQRAPQCGDVTALWAEPDGGRWIGTDGLGLWHEDAQGHIQQVQQLPNLTVTDLQLDSHGYLWVATYDHGIYRVGPRAGELRHYDSQSGKIPHDGVQRLALDGQERLWACSAFGPFFCFDPQTESYEIKKDEWGTDLMGEALCYDSRRNTVVLATFYGLWIEDLNQCKGHRMLGVYDSRQPLHVYQENNLLYDEQLELLWMSHNEGLTVWDISADTLYLVSHAEGLSGNVLALRLGPNHNIWASTTSGLSMIQSHRTQEGQWNFAVRNFFAADDSHEALFNPYAGATTPEGVILFGGPKGYSEFDSQRMLQQVEEPIEPRIAAVMLGDSLLTAEQLQHLDYDDLPLNVVFYTGNPVDATYARFAYRIKGLQHEWIETRNNTITLLSLPPGSYSLELKVAGPSGQWSEVRALTLSVSPPWWQSSWMNIVYGLLVLLLCIIFIQVTRRRQYRKVLTERKQLIQEQQARLAEMKLQFFTDISHDLRTPLTLIISPLEQLIREPLPEKVTRRLKTMHKNAQELLAEITTLLDFRKLDVGAEQLRLGQARDVECFVKEQCDPFYDVARERRLVLKVVSPTKPIVMAFDEDKLRKILYNLLSNAFKHSPDGGQITVTIGQHEQTHELLVKVADQGPGVADAEKSRIFELFYQSTGENPKPGSGIGLHIVRQFVELHKGRVWIEDNQPHGAVFCFTVGSQLVNVSQHKQVASAYTNQAETEAKADALAVATAQHEDAETAILVVDDNQDLCHFIEESLMDKYRVYCAYSGAEALSVLERENITLVVSDVMMPGIDGLELCNRIKNDLRYSHIPVILLTAKAADQSILEGLQQGADDYLTKPFSVERLLLRIAKFVEWAQRSHQSFVQMPDVAPREITITPLDEQFLQKAIDEVNDHLQDADFGVEELAKSVNMSRSQLYKKLTAVTGKSPLDFVRTLRMKRARQLLEKSQLQVSEVAYQVGFNTLKTFTENFKQEFGVTPSEFKKESNTQN